MKKTAYIHIGLHKTGTSAIQSTLHRFFIEGKLDKFETQYHHASEFITDFRCMRDKKYVIEQLHKDIQKYSKIGEKNIILSSEDIVSVADYNFWGFNYDLLPLLAEAFKDYNTKVIVYIRRQDLCIESLVNQRVKSSGDISYKNAQFHYNELIYRCLEIFKGGVIVRKYERENLYKNDAVTDFLYSIGLEELIDDYIGYIDETINSSLLPRAFRIAMADNQQYQLGRAEIESKIAEFENQYKEGLLSRERYCSLVGGCLRGRAHDGISDNGIRTDILKGHSSNFSLGSSIYGFLSPEERAEILAKYAEGNAIVAREYFGQEDGKLFNDKVPKNIIEMNAEPSATDIVQTFMPILIGLTKRCERLEMSPLRRLLEDNKERLKRMAEKNRKIYVFLRKIYRRIK